MTERRRRGNPPPVRYVCVSPRHGLCGTLHVSLEAAVKHCTVNRYSRPDDIILRYRAPALPAAARARRFLADSSFRPQPLAPLDVLTLAERARIPHGLFPARYEG